MIARYTRPEMAGIWTEKNRFEVMLEVEVLAMEAMVKAGKVPKADLDEVRKKASIDVAKIDEIEKVVKHDIIAFLSQVERKVGKAARHLHMGMTSSDVLDTALAVQMVQAAELLQKDIVPLKKAVADLARKHKGTLMAGRTHGVHAEPTTFGLKAAGWHSELVRSEERLADAKKIIAFGKISGAVGTYAHLDPEFEKHVLSKLGLGIEPVSTQIVPRDRHAQYMAALALVGGTLERIALEIRHLQRTEVLEAEEPFTEGQRGSSAMPHKRNPVGCENICGLARLLRSNAQAAFENTALWHERDISHSSVERVIIPDSTLLLDYMLARMTSIIAGLQVYPERMKENLNKTFLILASQRLLLEILRNSKGKYSREDAYKLVQRYAQKAWTEGGDFKKLVLKSPEIREFLSEKAVTECFDPAYFVRHKDLIFKRAGL
ncbi:MAG: adenylosuccinate lyase [Elusimicrobia bacterium RIFCSPLOWO2_01_FULL_60_11]|nr:MAG: adenylosuccinate lyase [Elusimicrobia bacterium RIFCSPLOWO2_01_FULL_60_11]